MKLEKLSITELKQAKKCEKWLYYKKSQPRPLKTPHYFLIGSVVHEVVELYLKDKLKSKGMDLKAFELLFNKIWEKEKSKADFSKMDEMEAKNKCWQYLYTYFKKRLYLLFAGCSDDIEKIFSFTARNGENFIKFSGKVDMLPVDKISAVDHKTSSAKWTQADADDEPQAHFYPFGLNANGYKIEKFYFNVITQKDVEVFEVVPDRAKFNYWVNYAFELQRNFPDNLFVNRKNCKWCEWKNICSECGGENFAIL